MFLVDIEFVAADKISTKITEDHRNHLRTEY